MKIIDNRPVNPGMSNLKDPRDVQKHHECMLTDKYKVNETLDTLTTKTDNIIDNFYPYLNKNYTKNQ